MRTYYEESFASGRPVDPDPKPRPMLPEVSLIFAHGKIVIATMIIVGTWVADAFLTPGSAESWTAKGILIVGIIWLARELTKERANAKQDRDKTMADNTAALKELKAETARQTTLFEAFGRRLMERGLDEKGDDQNAGGRITRRPRP